MSKYSTRALLDNYRSSHDRLTFLRMLSDATLAHDDDLAHIIATHGRRADVVDLDLQGFLDAIPDLRSRPIVLDAAIESVLRSKQRSGTDTAAASADLRQRYPMIADEIDAAVLLGSLLGSTDGHSDRMDELALPCDLGPELHTGERRYGLRERIASGEQGSVYLAIDRAMSERGVATFVAVKVARRVIAGGQRDRVASLEAVRARQVSHLNVAVAMDRGITDAGLGYSVFEYVDGGSLQDVANAKPEPMPAAQAVQLMIAIARGAQAIHAAGLLHRDIKPSNVLLSRQGVPKVTDFGLAFDQFAELDTASRISLAGTLGFAAPEQLEPGAVLNVTCDTYALGGVLLFLLTGHAANGSTVSEAGERLGRVGSGGPVNPMLIAKVRDATLAAICARATDRDSRRRYQSAEAFACDLERWTRNEPLLWLPTPRLRALSRWVRREWLGVAVGAAALVVAICASVYVLAASNREAIAKEREVAAAQRVENADLRRAIETEKLNGFRKSLHHTLKALDASGSETLNDGWLAQIAFFEGVFGPNVFGVDADGQALWTMRIDRALALAEDLRANRGHGSSVAAMQWDLLAGYWMLCSNRFALGRTQLTSTLADAKRLLPADDGLLDLIEKLHAAATILALPESKTDLDTTRSDFETSFAILSRPDSPESARISPGMRKLLDQARDAVVETSPPRSAR